MFRNFTAYLAISLIAAFWIFNVLAQTWDDSWSTGEWPTAEELANDETRDNDADDNATTQTADQVEALNLGTDTDDDDDDDNVTTTTTSPTTTITTPTVLPRTWASL